MLTGIGSTIPRIANLPGPSRPGGGGGSVPFEYTPIDNNYSMEFDGTNYIDCGNPTELQITGALSVSAWVKFTGNNMVLISKDDGSNRCWAIWADDVGTTNNPGFYIWSSGSIYTVQGTTQIDDGLWHHIAVVFEPSTALRMYIDGGLSAENTTGIPATIDNDPANVRISGRGANDYYINGSIDEVGIWNTILSEETIEAIYNTTNDNPGKAADLSETPEGAPVAWYRFE